MIIKLKNSIIFYFLYFFSSFGVHIIAGKRFLITQTYILAFLEVLLTSSVYIALLYIVLSTLILLILTFISSNKIFLTKFTELLILNDLKDYAQILSSRPLHLFLHNSKFMPYLKILAITFVICSNLILVIFFGAAIEHFLMITGTFDLVNRLIHHLTGLIIGPSTWVSCYKKSILETIIKKIILYF